MPTVAAVKMADCLESADIGALWLLIGFIFVILILDIIIPGSLPKWAIFAPIFVPLFLRLDVAPQTVLAAYRVGDSPVNVITPLMVYLPFIVLVAQRYKKDAGIGTIISLMIPYTVDRAGHLADLLRRLVPARHPAGSGLPGQALKSRKHAMAVRWYSTVIDSTDPRALADWWAAALGWQKVYEADDEVVIVPAHVTEELIRSTPWEQVGPGLVFVRVPKARRPRTGCTSTSPRTRPTIATPRSPGSRRWAPPRSTSARVQM